MPVTFWTSAVAWLAIAGVPPFAGFFSKDQILTEAYLHGFGAIWAIGLVPRRVLTAFYMSRWFFLVFLGRARHPAGPPARVAPVDDRAAGGARRAVGVRGLALNPVHHGPLYNFLTPSVGDVGGARPHPAGPLTEPVLIGSRSSPPRSASARPGSPTCAVTSSTGRLAEPLRGPFAELFERKFFVDELYEAVFVRFGRRGRAHGRLVRHAGHRRGRQRCPARLDRRRPHWPPRADRPGARLRRRSWRAARALAVLMVRRWSDRWGFSH
jgi:NADH-quinone oxidoreductase subunit L